MPAKSWDEDGICTLHVLQALDLPKKGLGKVHTTHARTHAHTHARTHTQVHTHADAHTCPYLQQDPYLKIQFEGQTLKSSVGKGANPGVNFPCITEYLVVLCTCASLQVLGRYGKLSC